MRKGGGGLALISIQTSKTEPLLTAASTVPGPCFVHRWFVFSASASCSGLPKVESCDFSPCVRRRGVLYSLREGYLPFTGFPVPGKGKEYSIISEQTVSPSFIQVVSFGVPAHNVRQEEKLPGKGMSSQSLLK